VTFDKRISVSLVCTGPMVCRGCLNAAGRATTDQELEEMLESGNPAIFTQGVSSFSFALVRTTM